MSKRTVTRSGSLSVAIAAALTLSLTACSSDDDSDDGSQDSDTASSADADENAGEEDAADAEHDADDAAEAEEVVQQSCGTNDLEFEITEEEEQGSFLVTATAKSGITCLLESERPSVTFGSSGTASAPAGEAADQATDTIELSGSTSAYARVNPFFETPYDEDTPGAFYQTMIIEATEGDPNPATLELPEDTEVLEPLVTHWHADEADASLAL